MVNKLPVDSCHGVGRRVSNSEGAQRWDTLGQAEESGQCPTANRECLAGERRDERLIFLEGGQGSTEGHSEHKPGIWALGGPDMRHDGPHQQLAEALQRRQRPAVF